MEKVIADITKYFGWIYLFLFLIVLILLIRQNLIKAIYHFKLLKTQYPKQLENISSYFSFMMITIIFKLDFCTLVWFWTPFYYNHIPIEKLCKDALDYHYKLKKSNRSLIILILSFIIVMVGGWFLFNLYGE